eukprot:5061606-Pyramimonas_sp.AAC.1
MRGGVITPRFAVDEGCELLSDGSWKRKVRAIDDCAASWVNSASTPLVAITVDTLDAPVAMARLAAADSARALLRLHKSNYVGAYTTLSLHSDALKYANAVWDDGIGALKCLQLFACLSARRRLASRGVVSGMPSVASW